MPGLVPSSSPETARVSGEYSSVVSMSSPEGPRISSFSDVLYEIVADEFERGNPSPSSAEVQDIQDSDLPDLESVSRKRPTRKRPIHHDSDSDEYVPGASPVRRRGRRQARPKKSKYRKFPGSLEGDSFDIDDEKLSSTLPVYEGHFGDGVSSKPAADASKPRNSNANGQRMVAPKKSGQMTDSKRVPGEPVPESQSFDDVYDLPAFPPNSTMKYRGAPKHSSRSYLRESSVSSRSRRRSDVQKKKEESQSQPPDSRIFKPVRKQRAKRSNMELMIRDTSSPGGVGDISGASSASWAVGESLHTHEERGNPVIPRQESEKPNERPKTGLQVSVTLPRRTTAGLSPPSTKPESLPTHDEDVFATPQPDGDFGETDPSQTAVTQGLINSVPRGSVIPSTSSHPKTRTLLPAHSVVSPNNVLVRRPMKALEVPRDVSMADWRKHTDLGMGRPEGKFKEISTTVLNATWEK